MSLEKSLWGLLDKLRGPLSVEEMKDLPIALAAIGYNSKNKLRQMATSGDLITKLISDEVTELPISESSKIVLNEHLDLIFKKIPSSGVMDITLGIAKLLEEHESIEILDAIISNLSSSKSAEIFNVSDELIKIIGEYFDMPIGSTLHSGVVGAGIEITKLIGDNDITFYGQESAVNQLMLAEIRFMFSAFQNEIKKGDVLKKPLYVEGNQLKQFDFVYNSIRFGLRPDAETMSAIKEDRYNRFTYFGTPSKANADLGYVISGLQALKDTGRGAFILPSSTLTRSGADGKIRDRFLQADVIDVIVELPVGLFLPNTAIPTALILFNKNKRPEAKGNIQFINASKFGKEEGRMKTKISEEGMRTISGLIKNRGDMSGISKVMANQEVEDTQILPSKYVFDTQVKLEDYGSVEINLEAFEQLDTVQLSDIAGVYRGYNALPKDQSDDGNYAIIKIADIEDDEINYDHLTKYQLGGRVKVDQYQLKKGDVVLSVRGHLLKVAVFESDRDDVLLSQNFAGIRLNKQYDPYFVKLYIESPIMQFILQSKLSGSTVMNLPIKEVESLPIPKIPIEEQQRIVKTYREIESNLKDQIKQLQNELETVKLKSFEAMGIGKTFTIK